MAAWLSTQRQRKSRPLRFSSRSTSRKSASLSSMWRMASGPPISGFQLPRQIGQRPHLGGDLADQLGVGQVTVGIEGAGKGGGEDFRLVDQVQVKKDEDLAQVVLGTRGA